MGIDFGAAGIKVVELKSVKKRPVLVTYGLAPTEVGIHGLISAVSALPSGASLSGTAKVAEDYYVAVVKKLCKVSKVKSKFVMASLPSTAVYSELVTMPHLNKDEFNHVINAELRKLLPRPIEEMSLDYQILPSADKNSEVRRVLVNAVFKNVVGLYTRIFSRAGLKLQVLEPEQVALARSLVGNDQSLSLVVDIGAERTNFFMVENAVAVNHHSLEIGGDKILSLAQAQWNLDDAAGACLIADLMEYLNNDKKASNVSADFLNVCQSVSDPLVKEIKYGLDLFLQQVGNENKRVEKIILSGGAARLPGFSAYLADRFQLKCYLGDPWSRVVYPDSLRPLLGSVGPRLAVSIGLALRNVL